MFCLLDMSDVCNEFGVRACRYGFPLFLVKQSVKTEYTFILDDNVYLLRLSFDCSHFFVFLKQLVIKLLEFRNRLQFTVVLVILRIFIQHKYVTNSYIEQGCYMFIFYLCIK